LGTVPERPALKTEETNGRARRGRSCFHQFQLAQCQDRIDRVVELLDLGQATDLSAAFLAACPSPPSSTVTTPNTSLDI
jgi:hypothetical protein